MLLNNVKEDFEWYSKDPEGYYAEEDRRRQITNNRLKEFLGEEFSKEPVPTVEDIENKIKERSARLAALHTLKAPKLLIDNEQKMLEESIKDLQNGKYAITKSELDYNNRYWKKYHEFFDQYNLEPDELDS